MLTIPECYRLQDVRDEEKMNVEDTWVSKNFAYQASGNAVTVGVVELMFESVLSCCGVTRKHDENTHQHRTRMKQLHPYRLDREERLTKGGVPYYAFK